MEKYTSGISICAGMFMLKWNLFAKYLIGMNIESGSSLNLYINLESIFDNICGFKRFNNLMNFYKQKVILEFEASILNLFAHYKGFFKKNNIKGKIYLYCTGLNDTNQKMKKINKWYRNHYFNKYTKNPEFKNIKELYDIGINDLKLITKFIPDCYIIESCNCDGSIIPLILHNCNNIIITKDLFDTLYCFNNYKVLFIKKDYGKNINDSIYTEPIDILSKVLDSNINVHENNIFSSPMYYSLLLSFMGDQTRNIDSLETDSFKTQNFIQMINNKVNNGEFLIDFTSIDSIANAFPSKLKNQLINNYKYFNWTLTEQMPLYEDIDKINKQIIDENDAESIQCLNNQRFLEFPINIIDLI